MRANYFKFKIFEFTVRGKIRFYTWDQNYAMNYEYFILNP